MSVKGSSVLAVGGEMSSLAKYSAKASSTGEDVTVEDVIEPRGGGDPAAGSSLRTRVSGHSIFIVKLRLLAAVGYCEWMDKITDEVVE